MQEKVKSIIESGDLEAYLLGELNSEESKKIAQYIQIYPEVRSAFELLEIQLESFSNTYKKNPPKSLMANVEKQIKHIQRFTRFSWLAVAVSIATLIGTAIFMIQENSRSEKQQRLVDTQIEKLTQSFDSQLADLRNQFIVLNSPETKTVVIASQFGEQNFSLTAYINPQKRLSYLQIDSLPPIPAGKCYQLWIERNGSKQSIGILPELIKESLFIPLPYKEKATAYLTIENSPGNLNPKAKNAIVNIPIE